MWGISREVSGSAFDGFGGCPILAIGTVLILKMIVHLCLQSALSALLEQRSEDSCFFHQTFAITECLNCCIYVKVRLRHTSFPSCNHLRLYEMTRNFEHYRPNMPLRFCQSAGTGVVTSPVIHWSAWDARTPCRCRCDDKRESARLDSAPKHTVFSLSPNTSDSSCKT